MEREIASCLVACLGLAAVAAGRSASQTHAEEELRKYVGRIVGEKGGAPEIRIETEESDALGTDGFRIVRKTADGPVVIRGSARRGCLYGVYEFLERFGGVRFYSAAS